MSSTVNVNMRVCDKKCRITATHREDGGDDVVMESDCTKLQQMAEALNGSVSQNDILDVYSSKVMTPEVRANVCLECLAVPAIFNACWLEEGMISKNMARKCKFNSVDFDEI
jgi:hypothetical protein